MSFATLLDSTADVLRVSSTGRDSYNLPIRGTASVGTFPCRLQQTEATEIQIGRDTFVSTWLLFLPPDASITEFDRVVVDGTTFEVVGVPAPVHGLSGLHHIETRLREVSE